MDASDIRTIALACGIPITLQENGQYDIPPALHRFAQALVARADADIARLDWCLSILTGGDRATYERRNLELSVALLNGHVGRDAVDAAMREEADVRVAA